jgi:hypothetical protein
MPMIRLRVVWGLLVVIAIFSPTRVLSSVDFPTFGRPMMPMNPDLYNVEPPMVSIFIRTTNGKERRWPAISLATDYIGFSMSSIR